MGITVEQFKILLGMLAGMWLWEWAIYNKLQKIADILEEKENESKLDES